MYRPTPLNTATIPLANLIRRSPVRCGFPVVALALALTFALSLTARAVEPPPDGNYPNQNTAEGENSLFHLTTGMNNTAVGFNALFFDKSGGDNTAIGAEAMYSGMHGFGCTAVGARALFSNNTGSVGGNYNTAVGAEAAYGAGRNLTAIGFQALRGGGFHSTAVGAFGRAPRNTAVGSYALSQDFGGNNTATGAFALQQNTSGDSNMADGDSALRNNTTGVQNSASGFQTLLSNLTGNNNTASGVSALQGNTTGSGNTALGASALDSNTSGSANIALGVNAGSNLTTGRNNIDIAAFGVAGEADTIRIGAEKQSATYIAGIYGTTVAFGVGVVVAPNGQLGTVQSSARFKQDIEPMDAASESILALNPVTFCYKQEFDPYGVPQFGLIAEQVEKVNPNLVVRGEDGKVNTVRYEAVNAMLLNEFLKEHGQVQQLKKTVAQQQKEIVAQHATAAQQQKQIEALTATVQKVSDQVVLSKPAPQLVANP
jgi:hypothetical protein